jgi:ACS family tartrate transporter-like MFS transporter
MSAMIAEVPMDSELVGGVDAKKLYRKLTWRLIPYLFLLYILAYLDRVNVGYAVPELKSSLHLTDSVFGLGAGIFFLGQFCFDLPSNLLLGKVGARRWIARIMVSWGLVATAMAWVTGPHSFLTLRFLLGVSEAGFFPGIILYLSFWFPSKERAKAIAKFMTATSLAGVVGGFVAHRLLLLDGLWGLHGWQWLILSEGVPTTLVGFSVLWVLRDRPAEAGWLTDREKTWLEAELQRDRDEGGATTNHRLLDGFKLPMLWVLAGAYFTQQVGVYTVNIWMPDLMRGFVRVGSGPGAAAQASSDVSLLSTLPYLAAAVCTVVVGWNSDRMFERRWHIAACFGMAAGGFVWAAYAGSLLSVMGAMTLAAIGYWAMTGPMWTLPTRVLGGRAAAGGVGVLTMIGSLGAFAGPYLTGGMKQWTHGFGAGLLVVAGLAAVGGGLILILEPEGRTESKVRS